MMTHCRICTGDVLLGRIHCACQPEDMCGYCHRAIGLREIMARNESAYDTLWAPIDKPIGGYMRRLMTNLSLREKGGEK